MVHSRIEGLRIVLLSKKYWQNLYWTCTKPLHQISADIKEKVSLEVEVISVLGMVYTIFSINYIIFQTFALVYFTIASNGSLVSFMFPITYKFTKEDINFEIRREVFPHYHALSIASNFVKTCKNLIRCPKCVKFYRRHCLITRTTTKRLLYGLLGRK